MDEERAKGKEGHGDRAQQVRGMKEGKKRKIIEKEGKGETGRKKGEKGRKGVRERRAKMNVRKEDKKGREHETGSMEISMIREGRMRERGE